MVMITHLAFVTLQFSATVVAFALVAFVLSRRGSELRRAATRMAVVFGVFALAAGHVWLKLGPEIDYRFEVRDWPLLLKPEPFEMEV
jgi:hypothetical protein